MTLRQLQSKIRVARESGSADLGIATLIYHGNCEWAVIAKDGNTIDTAVTASPEKQFEYLIG